jgi:L-alanine-DL-glutamate epimerase-like enolase superfamily enzyme
VQGCASHPWSVADAISVGQAFAERLPYRWYEEPCAAEDIRGYAEVTAAVEVPVSGVESYSVPEDFEHLMDAGGVNIVQPDLAMMGGFTCFERVVGSARRRGVDAIPHVWGSGVQLLTSVHAAFALGLPLVEVCTLLNPMRDATQEQPLKIVQGRIARADLAAAGSGAVLPAGAEERFAYQYGKGMLIK